MSKLKIYIFLFSFLYFGILGHLLGLMPDTELLYRYLTVLTQAVLILTALISISKLNKSFNVKLLYIFFAVSSLSFFYNFNSIGLATHLNGLRDPLTFLSALIVAESIFKSRYKKLFKKLFLKTLLILVILQIPVSLSQFFKYGTGDNVSGTLAFGDFGGSGILTQTLFLSSFFLFLNYGYKNEKSISYIKLLLVIIILLPVTINETKISFFLFPLYMLLLFGGRKRITSFVFGGLLLASIMIIYFNFYASQNPNQVGVLENFSNFQSYYASVNVYSSNITRLGKITLMFDRYSHNFLDFIFGLGYGITKGQNVLGQSQIGTSLQYLFQGSTVLLFTTLLTGGFLLTVLIGFSNFYQLISIKKFELRKGIWLFKWFLIIVSAASWLYNPFVFNSFLGLLIAYLIIWITFSTKPLRQKYL